MSTNTVRAGPASRIFVKGEIGLQPYTDFNRNNTINNKEKKS